MSAEILQKVISEIKTLKSGPTATDEYHGGYQDGRNDALSFVEDALDNLPPDLADNGGLRDEFAKSAMISMGTWMPMPDVGIPILTTEASLRARAEWAYRQADAMIAARKGGA